MHVKLLRSLLEDTEGSDRITFRRILRGQIVRIEAKWSWLRTLSSI
jgi:hypothetical protein